MTSSADLKERAAVISAGVKLLPMLLTHPPYIPASMKSDELNQRHRLLDMQPDEDGYLFSDVFGHAPGTATRVTSRIQALQQQLEALLGIQPSAASAVKKVVGEVTFSAPEQTFALACVSLGNINSKKPLLDLVLRRAMGVSEDDAERIWKFDNLVPAGTLPGAWVSSLQQAYETHRQEQVRASIARQAGRERNVSVDSTNVPNFDRSYSDRSLGTTRTYNSFATAASSFEEDHIAKSQADASAKPSPGAEYITDPDEFWGGVDDGDDEDSAQDEAQEPATEAPEAEQKAEDDYWARYDLQQPAAEGRRSSVNGEQHGGDIDGVGSTQGLSSAHSANHFSDFLSVGSAIAGAEHRELSLHAAGMSSPVEVHNEPALASGGLTIQALDRHDAKPQQPQWWEIPNGITEREPARPKLGRLSSIRSDATDYGTETLQDHRSQSTHADGISMLPNTSDILPHEDPDVGVEDDEERGIADVVTGEDFALDPIPEAIDHQATDDPYEDEESASPKDSKKDNFGLDTISDKTGGHDFDLDEPASSKATAPDVGQTAQSIVEPDGDALVSQAGPKVMIAKPSRDDLVADSPQAPNDEELEAAEAEDELGAVLSRSRAGSLLPSSPTASLSSVMAPRPPRSVVSVQSSYDTPADMELADLEAFYRARDQKRQEEKRERIRRGGQLPGIDDDENRGVKSPSSHQSPATRERSLSIKDLDPITALGIAPKSARESDQPRKVVRNASMDALRRLAEQQERESNMRWGGVAGSEISRQSSGSKSAQKGGGFGSFLQMAPSEVTDVSSVSFAKEPPLPSPTYLPQVNDPFLPQNESEHQATSTLEAADEVPELSQPNEETNESDQHASALSRGRLQQGEADTTLEHPEGTEARGAPENEAADEQHDLDLTLDDEEATNIGHAIASEMQLDTQEAQRVTKELDKQDLDPQNSQVAIGEDKSDENDAVDDERFNQKELHLPLPEAKSFLPSEAFNLKVRHAIDSPNASEGDSLVRQVTNSMRGHGKGRARVSPGGSSVIAASDSFMPSAASDASVRPLFGSRQGSWPSQTDSPDSGPGKLAARALRPARTRFNLETFQETDFDDGKSISSTQQQLGLDSPSEAPVKPGVGVSSNRSDLDGASNDQSIQSKPVKFRAVGSGPPPSATSAHTANMLHDYLKQQRRQALQSKRDRVVQKQQQRTK
ncbi:hypothetical protein IE81DRAFT_115129 [Ceraceosorus guamensis]|uniref:Uncharacterized protein n=1 Tax=Ceraceosorus guamensis TaxID=1522189 RepID=A0A316VYR3_9BASI|nr:hypothetical protein IE81DRAFT_115129 [Ceraceosorus guamensis]PWN42776.1 hypothetical protein IE81DRAFT_115129 [Ceraceosorus guamensis]